ncbi:MAG: tyrosine-protein phosphatase [Thermomicrobiales bacterium]
MVRGGEVIDTHIHLLPGIDDGAGSMEVAREMIARAREVGFRTLVATPHLRDPLAPANRQRVEEALAEVQAVAAAAGIEVRLGYEIMLGPHLPARLANGEAVTMAGSRAVLVEVPFSAWPHYAEQTLFALQLDGYRPVLAHPERYLAVQQDPTRAIEMAARGIVLQVTIGSLVGLFGRAGRQTAETLILSGAAQLVATDAHSAGRRFTTAVEGLHRLRELIGEERAAQLTDGVPRALLADAPLPELAPLPKRRADHRLGAFGRLLGRRRD